MLDLQHALNIGKQAAKAAGDILVDRFGSALTIASKSSPADLVTEVDHLAQERIIDIIHSAFPDHRFFAEEEGADAIGTPDSPYRWIIDPLDGTTNFTRTKKWFGSLIALEMDREFVIGILCDPLYHRLLHAVRGQGAFHEGAKLSVRATESISTAIICTNIRKRATTDADGRLQVSIPSCASLQNYGCAMTEMAEIALGRNDGVIYDGVGLWDIAAGCILIEEAGGRYRWEYIDESAPRNGVRCIASTPAVFDELCDFVWGKVQ